MGEAKRYARKRSSMCAAKSLQTQRTRSSVLGRNRLVEFDVSTISSRI